MKYVGNYFIEELNLIMNTFTEIKEAEFGRV